MASDATVFTGSLFNDNSYPPYAVNHSSFRRVDHFAGLGFVISRRRYVHELRPTWGGLQNWDETVQRLVARRRLASVVPEVGRALHVRRRDHTDDEGDEPWTVIRRVPRHPFESQRLNEEIIETGYDLAHLSAPAYDRHVTELIERSPYVDHVTDALFFDDPRDTVVYWRCSGDSDLHRILVERDLWGFGNGGVVRGSYRGTLYFRYMTAVVLVVCRNSYFRRLRVAGRRSERVEAAANLNATAVHRRHLGNVYRLTVDFRVIVGNVNESCQAACDRAADDRATCDLRGLWLANEHCDVVRYFVPECRTCIRATIDTYADGVLPGIEVAGDGGDANGGRCATAYAHYISCYTASSKYRRLCVCR
jgi:hypothetical protein